MFPVGVGQVTCQLMKPVRTGPEAVLNSQVVMWHPSEVILTTYGQDAETEIVPCFLSLQNQIPHILTHNCLK